MVLVALAGLVPLKADKSVSSTPVTVMNTPLPTTVTNDTAHPVPTLGVNNPASQPFEESLCVAGISGDCGLGGVSSFLVPTTTQTGIPVKHLVIQSISGHCTDIAVAPTLVEVIVGGNTTTNSVGNQNSSDNFVVPVLTATALNGTTFYSFATPTTIYADPNASLELIIDETSTNAAATSPSQVCSVQLQGFLATQ